MMMSSTSGSTQKAVYCIILIAVLLFGSLAISSTIWVQQGNSGSSTCSGPGTTGQRGYRLRHHHLHGRRERSLFCPL